MSQLVIQALKDIGNNLYTKEEEHKTMQKQIIYGESSTFNELITEIMKIVEGINQQTDIENRNNEFV